MVSYSLFGPSVCMLITSVPQSFSHLVSLSGRQFSCKSISWAVSQLSVGLSPGRPVLRSDDWFSVARFFWCWVCPLIGLSFGCLVGPLIGWSLSLSVPQFFSLVCHLVGPCLVIHCSLSCLVGPWSFLGWLVGLSVCPLIGRVLRRYIHSWSNYSQLVPQPIGQLCIDWSVIRLMHLFLSLILVGRSVLHWVDPSFCLSLGDSVLWWAWWSLC